MKNKLREDSYSMLPSYLHVCKGKFLFIVFLLYNGFLQLAYTCFLHLFCHSTATYLLSIFRNNFPDIHQLTFYALFEHHFSAAHISHLSRYLYLVAVSQICAAGSVCREKCNKEVLHVHSIKYLRVGGFSLPSQSQGCL